MTNTKHTPGTWAVERATGENGVGQYHVTPCSGDEDYGCIYSEADARLIAAAPDLLAALTEAHALLEYAAECEFDFGEGFTQAMEQNRAAIAKAKGET